MSQEDWAIKKRQVNRAYYALNKEHLHDYRKSRPDSEREYGQRHRERHHEDILAYACRYRENNRDLLRIKDKVYTCRRVRSPYHRTAEQERCHRRHRQERLLNTDCSLTVEEARLILAYGCLVCDSHDNLTLAHDCAVVNGGGTNIENCFCLCRHHNSQMYTHNLQEYRPDLIEKRLVQLAELRG